MTTRKRAAKAESRLVVAAPKLLEAVKGLLEVVVAMMGALELAESDTPDIMDRVVDELVATGRPVRPNLCNEAHELVRWIEGA